ncbi:MAG TPA: alkaline phosphatase family protein [Gemmatimonadaceae bacterium]|nr:alkaline phosphatase family protein [Gemmatimonadaceae bacterium]
MSVVILLADGARPDVLGRAMDDGSLPTLARLREEGSMTTVTTVFPSVTGPAYTPFLMGRYPGPIGLPGLRWFDRTRETARGFGNCRSYVGSEMRHVDTDLDPSAPTLFELAGPSLGALSVIGRGLRRRERVGRSVRFVARAARTHFFGNVAGWLEIDREVGADVARRIREHRPRVVFAALTGIDKTSHATGHDSPAVHEAMRIVDETAATIRQDAERAGRWDTMHLWIASDHGHSPVTAHDDLALVLRSWGHGTVAHPWTFAGGRDVAVMVSGNAMAHIYLDLDRTERPWWPSLQERWSRLADALLARASVDIMLLPQSPTEVEVRHRERGRAVIVADGDRVSYRPFSGDPLTIGSHESLSANEAYDATRSSDYPDALVQIARLASSSRSGEIILSAARDWDFRARHEPIPHVSSHGALHRDHMSVPLLTNRMPARQPRRTVDVMPSALAALGIAIPAGLDGESFVQLSPAGRTRIVPAHLADEPPDDQRGAESAVA